MEEQKPESGQWLAAPSEAQSAAVGPRERTRQALARWFDSAAGRTIVEAERGALAERLSDLFGYHLVQVGALPGADLLASSRTLHRCVIDLGDGVDPGDHPRLRGHASSLPVESDAVDVVLLPHVLEFEQSPHEALREAARVLVPEGHLLVCAFNPWSLLGAFRLASRWRGVVPWSGQFLAQHRLNDWLELLGFDLVGLDSFFFAPPLRNERMQQRLARLDKVGQRVSPMFGGAYLITARKRVAKLTPIRPSFQYRPRLVGVSLAGPPARVVGEN